MKRKYLLVLLLVITLIPFKVCASGGFGVSNSSISMYPGETKTITITSNNAVGRLNISSSNSSVASVNTGSIFIQNPGSSESITITSNNIGTATISVVASNNFATMDEEILAGQTRTITVNVVAKPAPTPTPPPTPQPGNNNNNYNNNNNNHSNNNQNNKSQNTNLKELTVDGYSLTKIDDNNYTLTVSNDVTSINLKATPEDSKSKITGTGNYDLNTGENNIEIIVISEAGTQNKINIKITRKDGYYLDDLDAILNNDKIKDINININKDTTLSTKDVEKIKKSKKTVKLNYYNEDKKLVYSLIINGSTLKSAKDFITTISYDSENKNAMLKLSNYADGLYISFKQKKNLPKGMKIRLYVGDKYKDNDIVNVYAYDKDKLELVKSRIKVETGYAEFDIINTSDYLITMSTVPGEIEKVKNSPFNVLSVVLIIIIILIVIAFVLYIIKNKKEKDNKNIATVNFNYPSTDNSKLTENEIIKDESIKGNAFLTTGTDNETIDYTSSSQNDIKNLDNTGNDSDLI